MCDPSPRRSLPIVTTHKALNYYARFHGVSGADLKAPNQSIRNNRTKARISRLKSMHTFSVNIELPLESTFLLAGYFGW
jgi:hypothetical protein